RAKPASPTRDVTAKETWKVAPFTPQPSPSAPAKEQPRAAASQADDVRRVPLSAIRRRIAERLVQAQHTTAMLTTFNEIDMTAVQELRQHHGQKFAELHGVPLGLMSFFSRAVVLALRRLPILNTSLEGEEILYHAHVNLGIAVSTDRGLVVPVLHAAETM